MNIQIVFEYLISNIEYRISIQLYGRADPDRSDSEPNDSFCQLMKTNNIVSTHTDETLCRLFALAEYNRTPNTQALLKPIRP